MDTQLFEQYKQHVTSIFNPDDTICFVAIEHNGEDRSKGKAINSFTTAKAAVTPECFEVLQRLNDTPSVIPGNSKPSIYLAPNSFPPALIGLRQGRTQENVVSIKALYADVDRDGQSTLEAIASSTSVPEPSIVMESRLNSQRITGRRSRGALSFQEHHVRRTEKEEINS